MILLGRSHDHDKQGARTADNLSEWMIADVVNSAIKDELSRIYSDRSLVMRLGGTLAERIAILKSLHKSLTYDCAIECHCNACKDPTVSGFFVLAWHWSDTSIHLADCILDQITRIRPDATNKGVCRVAADQSTPERDTIRWVGTRREYDKASWLGLLADTPGPAVIIEAGYLTNPQDAFWISEHRNKQALGWAIGRGIDKWLRERKEERQ